MASATAIANQIIINPKTSFPSNKPFFSAQKPISNLISFISSFNGNHKIIPKFCLSFSSTRNQSVTVKSSADKDGNVSNDDEEGVSLGTMKLPINTNIPRFEILLFQWANSLNQGAQLPLPLPMKVDKIDGGVRLGFVEIDDGKTQVNVYIDCQVILGPKESDPPLFRATRKGVQKNKVPPGEPRIMKSLLAALKKSVEIAIV